MGTIQYQCTRKYIQLQDKAPEPTDVKVKQNERISSSFANKTKTNLRVIVVVVLSLLAIVMVVTIALSVSAGVNLTKTCMDSLMEEIQELKMQLNETKESSDEYCKIENGPHTNRN